MLKTPKSLGFRFPAEWEKHRATWLSFPQNAETWEDRLPTVYPSYLKFIQILSQSEIVCINAEKKLIENTILPLFDAHEIDKNRVEFYDFKTNDSWCRDHGPAFLLNDATKEKAIVSWEYNAWGGKYPPFDSDNAIPVKIADALKLRTFSPKIVMEGGSIEVNGNGALLTSKSCLLNKNRNPHLSQLEIENYLIEYYGVEQILWVTDGIVGDDTDGHIDDTTRFVNETTVLSVVEHNKSDDNYEPLKKNLEDLAKLRLLNGQPLSIVELPMPSPVYSEGVRLPASYANFYISNEHIIVPTYRCATDEIALEIIQNQFQTRKVVGVDSTEIIWGLGSFHCLSQQEPCF